MGDNPTAGGAGDVTWTLNEILSRPELKPESGPSLIYASIPGPDLVKNAIKAGVGAERARVCRCRKWMHATLRRF